MMGEFAITHIFYVFSRGSDRVDHTKLSLMGLQVITDKYDKWKLRLHSRATWFLPLVN